MLCAAHACGIYGRKEVRLVHILYIAVKALFALCAPQVYMHLLQEVDSPPRRA